jgi:hypothetical protein
MSLQGDDRILRGRRDQRRCRDVVVNVADPTRSRAVEVRPRTSYSPQEVGPQIQHVLAVRRLTGLEEMPANVRSPSGRED